jgi:heavy metal sensor kinase
MTGAFQSVRFRLACWFSLALVLVLIVFWAILYGVVRHQSLHHHDDSLRESAQSVISILEREPDCASLTAEQASDLRRLNRLVLIHELAGQGQVFYRSPDLDPALLPEQEVEFRELLEEPESFQTLQRGSNALRIYSVRYTSHAGRRGIVRIMDSLGNIQEFLATLRWALVLAIPLTLGLAGSGGYWLAGRAFRPVDEVTRLAQQISVTNLSRRLPMPRTQDELGRLVSTFNQMIARLETSFEAMGRFTADASHELRTPLTIMRNTIDVALGRERSAEAYHRVLVDLLEEVERMSRLVEGLLFLARADGGELELERKSIRLSELAADVVESMSPLAESAGVDLRMEMAEQVEVAGDAHWLRQLLYNLLDNAIKYGGVGSDVHVAVSSRDRQAQIRVRDTGPGIAQENLPHLFERFYRVEKSRDRATGGAGLGLPIALWIAKMHGGGIEVESRPGHGCMFLVSLPFEP